ncbi:hypothetical protein BDZ89DRAFT_1068464 [Hymenopellis radicata]|nr:hypothetical protein BDZ89DRAFT_1068464 [Hymenopellis radicata]
MRRSEYEEHTETYHTKNAPGDAKREDAPPRMSTDAPSGHHHQHRGYTPTTPTAETRTQPVLHIARSSSSNHANEIIDVATLAVTIPQRRHVSFWAKSTLFTNPLFRSILSSSGAIPVQRNPNRDDGSSKAALFKSSSIALASGKVIAVFSEGASYTEPTIVQVFSGTAWAAVEYTRWRRKEQDAGKDVVIVPVGLVYTDKATFDSGLRVQYGTPIRMSDYVEELFDVPPGGNPDDVAYRVVQKVTQRIEQQLFAMTINASDWETLYAAETLRAIVAPQLVLKDWVSVSQQLIDLLSDPAPSSPLGRAKESLIKYYSLLHYTSLSHSD